MIDRMRLDGVHKLGALIIAFHWFIGYFWEGWAFKLFAYPALGGMTALFFFGLHLRKHELDELASDAFLAASGIWFVVLMLLGWLPPEAG